MSIKNTTFKYKEYKMEMNGAQDDLVITVNANKELEIIECQVCIWNFFIIWILNNIFKLELGIEIIH